MDKYELDRSEMMFVTGMLTRGTIVIDQSSDETTTDGVALAIRALRRGWQDGWVDKYADALASPEPEEEQENPMVPPPRTAVARKAVSLEDMSEWCNEPLGVGKKKCETFNRPWSEITYDELTQISPQQERDIGYLKWIVGPKFEAKNNFARTVKARVGLILDNMGERTPF
jgi:hypothetical protein